MSTEPGLRKESVATNDSLSPTTNVFPPSQERGQPGLRLATGDAVTPTMSRGEQQQQQAVAEATAAPISPSLSKSPLQESDEWDASKVPPSRFQKRKGSIYAVPSSRDGRIDSNYATKFHEKLEEMALRGKKRGSVSQ